MKRLLAQSNNNFFLNIIIEVRTDGEGNLLSA